MLSLKVIMLTLFSMSALQVSTQPAWKTYPFNLEPGHPEAELMFPGAEANHPSDMSDTWFVPGTLHGTSTWRSYQFVTIFDRNDITAVILDFYQVATS